MAKEIAIGYLSVKPLLSKSPVFTDRASQNGERINIK